MRIELNVVNDESFIEEMDETLYEIFTESGMTKEEFVEVAKQEFTSLRDTLVDRIKDW